RKGKTCGQAEISFAITSAGRKSHLQIGAQFLAGCKEREIDALLQDGFVRTLHYTLQPTIRKAKPLFFRFAISRPAERMCLPVPTRHYFSLGRRNANRK